MLELMPDAPPAPTTPHEVTSVPIRLLGPTAAGGCQPVTVGVPFPRGMLSEAAALVLSDSAGRSVPLQTSPLARWTDGSVKWLLAHFLLDAPIGGESSWQLTPTAHRAERSSEAMLRVERTGDEIVVRTGPATFRVGQAPGRFFGAAIGETEVVESRSARLLLVDDRDRAIAPTVDDITVDLAGPLRTTVRMEGRFAGRAPSRFTARFCFFAGTGMVRLRLTLHNPERAQHRGGLWDLGDPGSILFRELALELGLAGSDAPNVAWTAECGQDARTSATGTFEIYQDSSGGENWRSRNHVNREGRNPCSFRGYRVRTEGREEHGHRASPIVSLRGSSGRITAALPEFWQQFPKALAVNGRTLKVGFFPGQFADRFELQGGEQKAHTLWLDFAAEAAPDGTSALEWVHAPVRASVTPAWYAESGVFPYFAPAPDDSRDRWDEVVRDAVAGSQRFAARREVIDEYGWRNFGDLYADHEAAYYRDEPPVISHYNNQYDCIGGMLVQLARTGDVRWFELLDPLARHVIDIDIYHTARDRAAYNGGLFWHTDHYRDAATSTHRAYSRANHPGPGHSYGGGPCNEHNYTTGLLHYYYLTGDETARDVVIGLADWVVRMDDGRRTIFGLLDDGPTGLASRTRDAAYHGPGRGCGNSVNALLDGWLATGRRTYLEKAEALIRRCVHPADDVARLDLLAIEEHWSYTVFFSVLDRYLRLKAEAGELDAMYAYARASLLTYAAWMVEHERPYFDRPAELEYPTETWAAQELRKANVLRLGASYADEPLRARLLARGDELADRAWSDLMRFESRGVARSVALLLQEGMRDAYFRSRPAGCAPRAIGDFDFGAPQPFVPQKQRVLALLKSPGGLLRSLVLLANVPAHWSRVRPGDSPS